MTGDIIELRLPLKPEYLSVLRATTGVIAGTLSFNYDEMMQLRVAVSEVFDLGIKHATPAGQAPEVKELAVRFAVEPGKIEILIAGPIDYTRHLDSEEDKESHALLKSLMDEVGFGAEAAGGTALHMVKYKSAEEA